MLALAIGIACGSLVVRVFWSVGGMKTHRASSRQLISPIKVLVGMDLELPQVRDHCTGKTPPQLQSLYYDLGREFWSGNRNRTLLLRAMVESSANQEGPRAAVERYLALIGTEVADRDRLVRIIGSAAFASKNPSVNAVARAFAGIAPRDQKELIVGVAEAFDRTSRTSDVYEFLVECSERLGSLPSPEDQSRFLQVAVRCACYSGFVDRADLLALLESEALKSARSTILAKVLCEIATSLPGTLPELMRELAQQQPDSLAGHGVLAELPPELLRFGLSSLPEKTRVDLLKSHTGSLLTKSPQQATQFAREFSPDDLPPEARASLARALLAAGGEELRSWIDSLSLTDKRDVLKAASMSSIVSAWLTDAKRTSSSIPELGKAWLVASKGIPELSEEEMETSVRSAARELEPEEFGQILSLVPENFRSLAEEAAWKAYFSRLVVNEPQELATAVGLYAKNPEDRARLLGFAASVFASRAPQQAATWLEESQDNSKLQESLRSGLMTHALFPLQERARILLDDINRLPLHTPNPESLSGAEKLMANYLQTDYTKAIGFLSEVRNLGARESLTTSLVKQWAAVDPVTASEWMAELPAGSISDSALRELVIASKDDPEIALRNAAAISNPETREEAAMKVIEAWKGANARTLLRSLTNAGFIEAERIRLQEAIQSPKP